MALNYIALAILITVIMLVVYGLIAIWGIPYEIAKARGHPHQDAIGAATWVSLLTLGTLWPFLWIWALTYRSGRGWGFADSSGLNADRYAQVESRLKALEQRMGEK